MVSLLVFTPHWAECSKSHSFSMCFVQQILHASGALKAVPPSIYLPGTLSSSTPVCVQPSALSMAATPRGGPVASTASPPTSSNTILCEVLLPSLRTASGHSASPVAAQAIADVADALSRLEGVEPGAGAAFVANILATAAAAPLAGGGEVQNLRQLADKLGTVTRAGVTCLCYSSCSRCFHCSNASIVCL
jgi:hypothetical protein